MWRCKKCGELIMCREKTLTYGNIDKNASVISIHSRTMIENKYKCIGCGAGIDLEHLNNFNKNIYEKLCLIADWKE